MLYNKRGLLMDSFEREFRIANGKPVPYKFMGHDSVYDLLVSIPELRPAVSPAQSPAPRQTHPPRPLRLNLPISSSYQRPVRARAETSVKTQ